MSRNQTDGVLPSFCIFCVLLCLTIDLPTFEILVKKTTSTVTGHLHFNLIWDSTMTFSSEVLFPKMSCLKQRKKGEYFSFSMSCFILLPIQGHKTKKKLTVFVFYACEVLLDIADSIKYIEQKKKKQTQLVCIFIFFIDI